MADRLLNMGAVLKGIVSVWRHAAIGVERFGQTNSDWWGSSTEEPKGIPGTIFSLLGGTQMQS